MARDAPWPTGDQEAIRAIEDAGEPRPGCPKHMVYGPCGGVRSDGSCEVDARACPFVDAALVRWAGPLAQRPAERHKPAAFDGWSTPAIITDLRVSPFDRSSITRVTRRLNQHCDAVLIGDHHARPDFPPALMAAAVGDAGGRPWITLSCRDRNRVALEAELQALVELGAPGVHCVTGDARSPAARPDATQVFDLDSLRLTSLARHVGLTASVAATPAAPPRGLRPARLLEKERAGAAVCFVNHAGGPAAVDHFVSACRAGGVRMGFVPCVAVFTDADSLAVLDRFPGLVVDPVERERVTDAGDPRRAGIEAAVDQALRMLAIDGVVGINLSGSATSGPETESAAIMDEVAAEIRRRVAAT